MCSQFPLCLMCCCGVFKFVLIFFLVFFHVSVCPSLFLYSYVCSSLFIYGSVIDSSNVKSGYLFVCVDGLNNDGHQYASQAVKNGAVAVLSVHSVDVGVENIIVDDTSKWFSILCNEFYNFPSKALKVIGISGTDGKTTTTSILNQMLNQVSKSGYIGTNGIIYGDKNYMLGHTTTPEADDLQAILRAMVDDNVEYVNLEVTSHALVLKRCDNVEFDVLGITNITSEHLDMHKTVEAYVDAKKSLFDYSARVKILNADDKYFNYLSEDLDNFISYGVSNQATYQAKNIRSLVDGLQYTLVYNDEEYDVKLNLIGEFNVYNTLLAIAVCHSYGISLAKIVEILKNVEPIAGRANFINCSQPFNVIVDFAHTPAGIEQIVKYFKNLFLTNNNKVYVVVGSAGDRDRTKRSVIGSIVSSNADYAIYTNEDPRSEDEMQILKDIAEGSVNDNYELIPDRPSAIRRVFELAKPNDVVLLLGKGIENSIEFSDGEHPYNESEVAKSILKTMFCK